MRLLLRFNGLRNAAVRSADTEWRLCSPSSSSTKLGFRCIVTSCRAVLLPRFGGPEVLELRNDVGVPDLKPNEVLVRVRAVSVNPLDTRMRSGYGRSLFAPLLPLIMGRDVSGEVAAFGASVRSLVVGQEVFGALHPTAVRGTYTDYAILPEDELTAKPVSISHVTKGVCGWRRRSCWFCSNSACCGCRVPCFNFMWKWK